VHARRVRILVVHCEALASESRQALRQSYPPAQNTAGNGLVSDPAGVALLSFDAT